MSDPKKIMCVLIPAYNERLGVRRSIVSCRSAGLAKQDIYVVDDGSKDETTDIAKQFGVNVLTKPNGGKASALKAGIKHFELCKRYEYISLLDADSVVSKGYFDEIVKATTKFPNAALFCGCQRSQRGKFNWLQAWRAVEYAVWCGIYREAQHATGTVTVAPGFGSTYRAFELARLDIDGSTIVEDMDMTIQLQRRGAEIVYVPEAIVATQDPRKFRDYVGQMTRWYRGTWQVIRKHKLGRYGQRVDWESGLLIGEMFIFGCIMMLLPLWLYLIPRITVICLLMDQALVFTYTLLTAIRERRWDVIVAYPTFSFMRLTGYFLFARAFFQERRSHETQWFSVVRY